MLRCWYVYESRIVKQDARNPTIDNCVGLHVGVVEHALDVLRVHFHYERLYAVDVKSDVV